MSMRKDDKHIRPLESKVQHWLEVVHQKRVRVFHQGFQTPKNRSKISISEHLTVKMSKHACHGRLLNDKTF